MTHKEYIDELAQTCHNANIKWWQDPKTQAPIERNKGELIALMHSELSEMLEGVRKNTMDTHLPEYTAEEVELADLLIRAFDYAGGYNLRLGDAFIDKMQYNATRADHTHAARLETNGKKF